MSAAETAALELRLPRFAKEPSDGGFYGPDSVSWRITANPVVVISATIAAGAIQICNSELFGKLVAGSTYVATHGSAPAHILFAEVGALVFDTYGSQERAERFAHHARERHGQLKIDSPELFKLVAATLTWTVIRYHEYYGRRLHPRDRDAIVEERRGFARRYGAHPKSSPFNGYEALNGYAVRLLNAAEPGDEERAVTKALVEARFLDLPDGFPLAAFVAGPLPSRARQAFGLPDGEGQQKGEQIARAALSGIAPWSHVQIASQAYLNRVANRS